MKKVALYTLGCKLNFSETSSISRMFEDNNFQKVAFSEAADVYVINTCSVTENADKKCRKVVREALKYSPGAFVAIIGCYAQLKPQDIAKIEGVDAVLGASEKFKILDLLGDFNKEDKAKVYAQEIEKATHFNNAYSLNDRTRTFLKVQDGCDYSCTFCTIPLARGKSRSNTIESVVKDAVDIAETGVKEIVLTGVNIGDFGIIDGNRKENFIDLVKDLDKVEGINRFRISSIEPNLLSKEIIDYVSTSQRFVPHFHLPLQSGSNKVLKLMRRRYQKELYVERVSAIKNKIPHCCIGVDVIVGFPGETNEDFLETYNFLNELDISYLHVFTYSERDDTEAINIGGIVPKHIRAERSKMLHILSEKKKRCFYEENIKKTYSVLFENKTEEGMIFGHTENYIRITHPYDPMLINEITRLQLKEVSPKGIMSVYTI